MQTRRRDSSLSVIGVGRKLPMNSPTATIRIVCGRLMGYIKPYPGEQEDGERIVHEPESWHVWTDNYNEQNPCWFNDPRAHGLYPTGYEAEDFPGISRNARSGLGIVGGRLTIWRVRPEISNRLRAGAIVSGCLSCCVLSPVKSRSRQTIVSIAHPNGSASIGKSKAKTPSCFTKGGCRLPFGWVCLPRGE